MSFLWINTVCPGKVSFYNAADDNCFHENALSPRLYLHERQKKKEIKITITVYITDLLIASGKLMSCIKDHLMIKLSFQCPIWLEMVCAIYI